MSINMRIKEGPRRLTGPVMGLCVSMILMEGRLAMSAMIKPRPGAATRDRCVIKDGERLVVGHERQSLGFPQHAAAG